MSDFMRKIFEPLFRSRFEPLQVVLAISSFVHGVWLLAPQWPTLPNFGAAPRGVEIITGLAMVFAAIGIMTSMASQDDLALKQFNFAAFLAWFGITSLVIMSVGLSSVVWLSYLTVSLVAVITYLSASLWIGVDDE